MLLSLLVACGGHTSDNTEELVTTEATVTEEGLEVIETTTNENGTTTTTTTNEGSTTETTSSEVETTENTETTNENE